MQSHALRVHALFFASLLLSSASAQVSVTTFRNDNSRTGQNLNETVLTPANVNSTQFGKLFSYALDGPALASPLYVAGVNMPGQGLHNVVYVATQHDTVYAFDADTGATLWTRDFGAGGEFPVPVPNPDMGCAFGCDPAGKINITGNQGITSTPVIDLSTSTLYVVDISCARNGGYCYSTVPPNCCTTGADSTRRFGYTLHALDVTTGADKTSFGSPHPFDFFGDFDPKRQIQRPALLLATVGGVTRVYVAFGSYADLGLFRGWIFAFPSNNFNSDLSFVTSTSPSTGAGIWMAGQGPSFDGSNVFFLTGNGSSSGGTYFGSAFVRTGPDFTNPTKYQPPWFQALDGGSDVDLGSSGALIVPNTNFVVGGGKQGVVTVLNRTTMQPTSTFFGSYFPAHVAAIAQPDGTQASSNCNPQRQSDSHIHGAPVHWRSPAGDRLYLWGEVDYLKEFALAADGTVPTQTLDSSCCVQTMPSYGATGVKFGVPQSMFAPTYGLSPTPVECGMPGGMLSVSANGSVAGTGIVWAIHPKGHVNNELVWATAEVPGTLYALDASDVSKELWDSSMVLGDAAGNFAKFSSPVVADGRVYVNTRDSAGHGQISVYGLRPSFNLAQ